MKIQAGEPARRYQPREARALEPSAHTDWTAAVVVFCQLQKAGCPERAELPYHKAVINGELPLTIGGGIGQSRICMFFLRKAHIGEVQCSLWSDEVMEIAKENGLQLL